VGISRRELGEDGSEARCRKERDRHAFVAFKVTKGHLRLPDQRVDQSSRPTFGVDGGEWGGGVPIPSRLRSLGERHKLPQRGPGRSRSRKRVLVHFALLKTM